jgi:hypothetical protein
MCFGRAIASTRSPPVHVMLPPTRHMQIHQRLEDLAVIRDSQMQQLVRDYEVLKPPTLVSEVLGESNDSLG